MKKSERAQKMNERFKKSRGITLTAASNQTQTAQTMNTLLRGLTSANIVRRDVDEVTRGGDGGSQQQDDSNAT